MSEELPVKAAAAASASMSSEEEHDTKTATSERGESKSVASANIDPPSGCTKTTRSISISAHEGDVKVENHEEEEARVELDADTAVKESHDINNANSISVTAHEGELLASSSEPHPQAEAAEEDVEEGSPMQALALASTMMVQQGGGKVKKAKLFKSNKEASFGQFHVEAAIKAIEAAAQPKCDESTALQLLRAAKRQRLEEASGEASPDLLLAKASSSFFSKQVSPEDEDPESRQLRVNRERTARYRANMTEDQKTKTKVQNRERQRKRRAHMTPEEIDARRARDREKLVRQQQQCVNGKEGEAAGTSIESDVMVYEDSSSPERKPPFMLDPIVASGMPSDWRGSTSAARMQTNIGGVSSAAKSELESCLTNQAASSSSSSYQTAHQFAYNNPSSQVATLKPPPGFMARRSFIGSQHDRAVDTTVGLDRKLASIPMQPARSHPRADLGRPNNLGQNEDQVRVTLTLGLPPSPQPLGLILQDDMQNFGLPVLMALGLDSPLRNMIPPNLHQNYWIIRITDGELGPANILNSKSLLAELQKRRKEGISTYSLIEFVFLKRHEIPRHENQPLYDKTVLLPSAAATTAATIGATGARSISEQMRSLADIPRMIAQGRRASEDSTPRHSLSSQESFESPEDKKEKVKARDRERQRLKRARMTEEERSAVNAANQERQRKRRKEMTADQKAIANAQSRERMRRRRANMSAEEKEADKSKGRERQRKKRGAKDAEDKEEK